MTDALIIAYSGPLPAISIKAEAIVEKDKALEGSLLLQKVDDVPSRDAAVLAQASLNRVSKLFEDSRVEVTKPLLKAQRDLKALVDKHTNELNEEYMRLAKVIGDYETLQSAKARAEEMVRDEKLSALELEREAMIAKATSHEEIEAIKQTFEVQAASLALGAEPMTRAPGQVVRQDWDVSVKDVHALYRYHPHCVKLEPRMAEIKLLLDQGIKVAGVEAKKITVSGVRVG